MRTTLTFALLTVLVLPLSFAPPAAAAPTCQTLERIVPVATLGTTTTARTDSCWEVFSGVGYTYRIWYNATILRTTVDATGYTAEATTLSYHTLYTTLSATYEDRYHVYRAQAYDWDSPYLRAAGVAAEDYQAKSGGQCGEGMGAAASQQGPHGGTGVVHYLYGGSTGQYVLPCTPEDLQTTLP